MALNKRYQAGTAWIKVAPDFRGWTKDLRDQVEGSAKNLSARVSLDTSDARATLREFERAEANVEANVKLSQSDLAKVREQLQGLHKHKRDVVIRTELDNTDVRKKLREFGRGYEKFAIPADIKLNKKSVTRTFDRIQKDFAQRASEGIKFDAESLSKSFASALKVDKFQADINRARKELDAFAKAEKKFQDQREAYANNQISWEEITDLGAAYAVHEKEAAKATKRLEKYTKQQNAARRQLNKDLKLAQELSQSLAASKAGSNPRINHTAREMSERRVEIAATEKQLSRLEKAQDRYNEKLAQYQRNEIGWDEISDVADVWAKQEKAASKARKRLTEFTEAQNKAQAKLNKDLEKARALAEEAAATRRRPNLIARRDDKDVSYFDRVRDAANSSPIAKSRLEGDTVAWRNAAQEARRLDAATHSLASSTHTLEKAKRDLAAAQLEVNNLRARGNISSKNAQAALERESRAFHVLTTSARQVVHAQRAVDGLRDSYNGTAAALQRRIDLNPIKRFGDVMQNNVARGISFFTDRLILAGRLISSVTAVGMAAGAALAGLGLVNLVPLVGSLTQVVGVLGLIPGLAATAGAAIAAIGVGFSGISGAFKAANKLNEAVGTGGSTGDTARATRAAQKQLNQANKAAARTATSGARSIADAEKGVSRSQKGAADAQKNLTKARKDAQRQNEDLAESVRDMAHEEEDAALSVEEARQRLGEVLRDPDSTNTERKRADFTYRQALEQQRDLRREHSRTKDEFADAQRKGIEGSDVVVEAQERVREAAESVSEAQQSLAQAQQDAADANADAMERVVEAQENLASAMRGGSGVDAEAKALEEYNRELAKLAPNAQGFVVGIMSMRDSWMNLRKAVQQRMFRGMAEDVHELATGQLPLLERGLGDTAESINVGIRHAFDYLKSQRATMDFTSIFKNSAEATEGFARSTSNLFQALVPVAEVGTRFMPWFGRSLEDTTRKWRVMAESGQASGSMESFFTRSIVRAQQLGRILWDVGGLVKQAFNLTSGLGLESLTAIETRLEAFRTKLAGDDGGQLATMFADVRQLFHSLLGLASSFVQIIVNDIVPAFQLISDVTGPILQSMADLGVFISEHIPLVRTLLSVWLAFKIVNGTMTAFGGLMNRLNPRIEGQATRTQRLKDGWTAATRSAQNYQNTTRLGAGLTAFGVQNGKIAALGRQWDTATTSASRYATVMGGVRSAASSLYGFLGGGWGIALAGAAIGFTLWDSHRRKLQEAAEAAARYNDTLKSLRREMSEALRETQGAKGPQVLSVAEQEAEARLAEIRRVARDGGTSMLQTINGGLQVFGTLGEGNDYTEHLSQLDAIKDRAKAQQKVLDDLEISASDVARAISGTDHEWSIFNATLRQGGEAGEQLAADFAQRREDIQTEAGMLSRLTPGYLDLVDAIGTLGDKSSSTADKFDALRRAFDALVPGNEAREALSRYGETIDEIRSKIEQVDPQGGFGSDLLDASGNLNVHNQDNARVLEQAILDGQQAIGEAQLQNVEPQKLQELWEGYNSAIRTLGGSMGLASTEMDGLLERMFATPDSVTSVVRLENTDPVTRELGTIALQLQSLKNQGKPIEAKVMVQSAEARAALESIGANIEWLDASETYAKVGFDTAEGLEKFTEMQTMLSVWNTIRAEATVDLDTQTFTVKQNTAQDLLTRLDAYQAKPWATLLYQALADNQGGAIELLNGISRHPATATARLNTDQLLTDVQRAQSMIDPRNWVKFQLGLENGTPAAPQVTDPFNNDTGIEIPDYLLAPEDRKKKPGNYRGGRLPGFNVGGRMPSSGPGSQERDGFLAVGPDGRPVARVDGGEWIINSAASAEFNELLWMINSGRLRGFAAGGSLAGQQGGKKRFGLDVIGNPFSAMASGVMGLGGAFGQALGGALPAWQQFGSTLASTASTLIQPALGAINSQVNLLGSQFPFVTQMRITPPWVNMANLLSTAKQTILDPMFSGVNAHLDVLAAHFPAIASVIEPTWLNLTSRIMAAKTGVVDPAFSGIQEGLRNVQSAFGIAVPAIALQWDGIRSATADPVRFTINTVFNDGLVGMWNSVSDLIGSKPMPRYTAKFARGGVLPGNTPGVDIHTFYSPELGELHLGGGEGIIRPEAVRAMGGAGAIDKLNKDAREGRLRPVKGNPAYYSRGGVFGRFARGGTISGGHIQGGAEITSPIQRVMWDAVRTAFPNVILTSGTRYADVGSGFDNHMGQRALDLAGPMPQIARWIYQLNKTQPVEELIHAPLAGWQNLKSGRPLNYGAGTDADHYDHVHWAMAAMRSFAGRLISMAGGSAGGAPMQSPEDMVKELLAPMKADVQNKITARSFPGAMGQLPNLIFSSMSKQIEGQAVNLARMSGMYNGPAVAPGGGVERWRPMVIAALRRNGFEPSRRNQDLMLAQIQSESGGNPEAVQQVVDVNTGGNEAEGLLQIAKGTWPGVRDPSLPDNRRDPWANMNGALRYYRREYGDDLGTMWGKGHGYDRGGIWNNNTLGWNTSGKPEAVFTNKEWHLIDALVGALTKPEAFRAMTMQPVSMGAVPAPQKLKYTPPQEEKEEAEQKPANASPTEYTPAKIDPETNQPYAVDPETGVPIDPKTGQKFTVDPVTQQAITIDDRGLYIDPETGKPFYGEIAKKGDTSGSAAPAIEYTPAKVNPETQQPYETDENTGVPIDPKTGKPFAVDPVTQKPITKDERGLYVDPETGKPFYGIDAEKFEQNQSSQTDTFTFDNNADELGVKKDWVDEYTGPMSDVFKKGKLLGQLGNALAQPGAIQRIGNDKLMNAQIQEAKKRQDELSLYKSDQAQKINELRAQGKHEEAAAIEREARQKIAGMSEMPGTSKGTQAMLATMEENPGDLWRRQSEKEWQQWAGENWAGIAETVAVGAAGAAGNSGSGQLAESISIHTTDISGAFREVDRRSKRQSRANSRVGRR
ncbi:tape measure protein [Gordonia phage Cucurbita]|uniref:tail length tape measure protein n=1 Tax=Gordonia phage Cucurbita TaxID=1887645 RepID=UPI00084F13CF|nr:tail length tape measure protein [Gordonia phage Cucurbita]AOE44142.1 tape measure protein [Gordonia phage Cucurbita]